jgi:hypothetical protein
MIILKSFELLIIIQIRLNVMNMTKTEMLLKENLINKVEFMLKAKLMKMEM